MRARFRAWWQQIQKHRWTIGLATIVFIAVVVIALIIAVVLFNGTGFNGYNKVTTVHTISGTNAATVTRTEEYQPGKTLWDLLQLLGVLAIPVVVGLGAARYTVQQGKVSERENTDNQREAALQAYMDKMSELLLKEHLGELTVDGKLNPEYEQVRKIARIRTITVLNQLDARRVGYVFAFLLETELMSTTSNDNVVSLDGADLHGVYWSHAKLVGANLSGVNLRGANLTSTDFMSANLSGVNLLEANLSGADFYLADLNNAQLSGADLSGSYLHRADLTRANLGEIFYGGAFFSEARHINSANLSKANLSEANLSGTNLKGVDLSGADLKGAFSVSNEDIERQTKSLKGATMPLGDIHR